MKTWIYGYRGTSDIQPCVCPSASVLPPLPTGIWSIGRWYLSHKYGKLKNWKMSSKLLCLMVKNIHDCHGTVSNSFGHTWEIYDWKFKIFTKKNAVIFELEIFSFFKWVKISLDINWHHYQIWLFWPYLSHFNPSVSNAKRVCEWVGGWICHTFSSVGQWTRGKLWLGQWCCGVQMLVLIMV